MSDEDALERKRQELVESPLFNLTFMPSLLLLPDSLRIYRATDAATRILGYSHDELQERTLYDLLVEPREQVDAALQQARTQPPFVLTVRRPNREERIIEGTVHPLDEYALLHFSFADLTDLHLPRRALRETSAISPRHTGYAYLRELVCAISRTFDGAHTYTRFTSRAPTNGCSSHAKRAPRSPNSRVGKSDCWWWKTSRACWRSPPKRSACRATLC
jgi:PAS domain S-box-containing protein